MKMEENGYDEICHTIQPILPLDLCSLATEGTQEFHR